MLPLTPHAATHGSKRSTRFLTIAPMSPRGEPLPPWQPKRRYGSALVPAQSRRFHLFWPPGGGHGKRRTGGATDAGGGHQKRRASQCQSHGALAAGDLLQVPAAGPNAAQLITHHTKRRGTSRHILPEALSDRPLEGVADWSTEQSMAC